MSMIVSPAEFHLSFRVSDLEESTAFYKTVSTLKSLANLRLAVQYVHYFKFNGGIHNYDGSGRNAVGNDTLFLSGWLAF